MTDEKKKTKHRISVGFTVRLISWGMLLVAIFTVIMTFLSTFYIWVTDLFSNAQTLIAVLMVTFAIWSLRNFLDSRIYPIYKVHGFIFLLMTIVAAYLLTTPVF